MSDRERQRKKERKKRKKDRKKETGQTDNKINTIQRAFSAREEDSMRSRHHEAGLAGLHKAAPRPDSLFMRSLFHKQAPRPRQPL